MESDNVSLLASLEAVISWYKEAGVTILCEEKAIDRIAEIATAKQNAATSLPKTSAAQAMPAFRADKIKRDFVSSQKPVFSQKQEKDKSNFQNAAKNGRNVADQIFSEAAQKAKALAEPIHSMSMLQQKVREADLLSIQKTATCHFLGDRDQDEQSDMRAQKSKIVVVNSAPSAQDDRSGQLLSGAEGVLFDKMMASIGINREDIWLTNSVFWRPPGDRMPTQTEIATCLPILERIIQIVRPQLIITMGTSISQILTGQTLPTSKLRGKFYPYTSLLSAEHDITAQVCPFYHPQNLIASPVLKADAWYDLLAIQNILKKDAK